MQTDFPTGWKIIRKTKLKDHHEKCCYRVSKGCLLCDCAAIEAFIATCEEANKEYTALMVNTQKAFYDKGYEVAKKDTAMEICNLIDEIELDYQNTSTEEWKLFKRIRNTIRDKFVNEKNEERRY